MLYGAQACKNSAQRPYKRFKVGRIALASRWHRVSQSAVSRATSQQLLRHEFFDHGHLVELACGWIFHANRNFHAAQFDRERSRSLELGEIVDASESCCVVYR